MIACGSYTFDFVILLVNNDIRNVLIYADYMIWYLIKKESIWSFLLNICGQPWSAIRYFILDVCIVYD